MVSIPIFRTAHLIPHILFLRKLGAPVERCLRHAKLPVMIYDQPNAYLPVINALHFLSEISCIENIDSFGLRGIERCSSVELNQYFVATLFEAPSLYAALLSFLALVHLENPSIHWRMESYAGTVKIHSSLSAPCDMVGLQFSEWKQNMAIVDIVRTFVSPVWIPQEMAFKSNIPLGRYAYERFPDTHLLIGQKSAWISLPQSLLSLAPKNPKPPEKSTTNQSPAVEDCFDFPRSLKLILKAYLGEGHPSIEQAAEITGTSVRTLQRRLKQLELNYSTLLQHAQFEYASELLKDPNIRTIDIAYAVGYEDPSNFARAFRRIAGVSPRQYREQLYLL